MDIRHDRDAYPFQEVQLDIKVVAILLREPEQKVACLQIIKEVCKSALRSKRVPLTREFVLLANLGVRIADVHHRG